MLFFNLLHTRTEARGTDSDGKDGCVKGIRSGESPEHRPSSKQRLRCFSSPYCLKKKETSRMIWKGSCMEPRKEMGTICCLLSRRRILETWRRQIRQKIKTRTLVDTLTRRGSDEAPYSDCVWLRALVSLGDTEEVMRCSDSVNK